MGHGDLGSRRAAAWLVGASALLLFLAAFPVQEAAASPETTVTWTTTADFDAGNKSDPGALFFAENGVDQPLLGYISHPSAMYDPMTMRTYVVWQAGRDWLPYITYYDHAAKRWASPAPVAASNPIAGDGHGAPVVFVSHTGRIHVFCCSHDTTLKYYRSTNANDVSAWTAMPDPFNTVAYPNVFEYRNVLYLMFRVGPSGSGSWWGLQSSADDGSTWSGITRVLDLEEYFGNSALSGSRLYLSWVQLVGGRRTNVYVAYRDLSTGTMYGMDGAALGPSIVQDEADAHARVSATGVDANQPYVALLHYVPYVTWNQGNDTGTEHGEAFQFSRWTGTAWTAPVRITGTDAITNYQALVPTSPKDIKVYLTAPGFDHGCSGDCEYSGDIEEWTSTDNGATFARTRTILSEAHAGEPVNFPILPLNARADLRLVFAEFGKVDPSGSVGVDDQTNLKLYAWGSRGFVNNAAIPSGAFGVETSSDNPGVPGGRFELANGRGDAFSVADGNADTFKWHFAQSDDGTGNCTRAIAGGVARYSYTYAGAGDTGRKECYAIGTFGVTGDFDFRMKAERTAGNRTQERAMLTVLDAYDAHLGAPRPFVRGRSNGLAILAIFGNTPPLTVSTNVTNGVGTRIGFPHASACAGPTTCYLRVTRVGTVFTSYTSPDGNHWIADTRVTKAGLTGTVYLLSSAQFTGVAAGTGTVELSGFRLAAGGVVDGFRALGRWVSPLQTYTGNIVTRIAINFTGATAAAYIDRVFLVGATGAMLWQDTTHRTAGANLTLDVPSGAPLDQDWALGVDLAGDGAGSVAITEITVTLVPTLVSGGSGPVVPGIAIRG